MATTVQQQRRTKGWRKPEGSVSVTRPGPWGNPFRVVPVSRYSAGRQIWRYRVEKGTWRSRLFNSAAAATEHSVGLFREWAETSDEPAARWIREHVQELRDRIVLCYCDGPPCHAYALADMADATSGELDQ